MERYAFPAYEKFTGDFKISTEKYREYQERWNVFLRDNPKEDEILTEYVTYLSEINPKIQNLKPTTFLTSSEVEFPAEIRMSAGIQMVRSGDFESAAIVFQNIKSEESLVPALSFFYQAIVQHHLLQKESCLEAITKIEQLSFVRIPKRFGALIALMKNDLNSLSPESLEHISRQMKVVEQHLGTGNVGEKTVVAETGVIESLDKMIKNLEEMQKKQQARSSSARRPSGKPPKDAKLLGGNGPGKIDRKTLKSGDSWGNLPEKQRETAIQKIENEFPSHYQHAIEQYFIKMSDGGEQK